MKKLLLALLLATAATGTYASDFFGGGNDGEWKQGPYGPYWDESDWPEWTPMYWMEEFMNEWDNNDDEWGYGGGYGGMPYGGGYGSPYGGGMPQMPYGAMPQMPYGGGYPVAPAPAVPQVPVR